MWDALFTQDNYVANVIEGQLAPVSVLNQRLASSNAYT